MLKIFIMSPTVFSGQQYFDVVWERGSTLFFGSELPPSGFVLLETVVNIYIYKYTSTTLTIDPPILLTPPPDFDVKSREGGLKNLQNGGGV